jgi:hypothetical protein
MRSIFDPFQIPKPPADLREKVLASARSQPAIELHWIDRLWENRPLRISWISAVVTLSVFYLMWQPPAEPIAPEARYQFMDMRKVEGTITRSELRQVIHEVESES